MSRDFAFPSARPRFAPDRVVDIEHLALRLALELPTRSLRGEVRLAFRALVAGLEWITLDAVELEILTVELAGRALSFAHDGRRLRVRLPAPAALGARLAIDVVYRGCPRRGLYFVAPDAGYPHKPVQVWSQGQDEDSRYWFPCFDAPHEKATSELEVTVPAGLTALSNGVLVADRTDGDRRTMHWRLDVPHSCYLITLVVGELASVEARWRDVPVVTYAERARLADAERTLARTPQMLELFSRCFGVDYPYPRYAQVFVADFIFGGMENTSATTLTDTVLLDERAALDHDVDALVAHELAHQWFGDLVTCRDWGEGWLNEGFATYAEYLWREHYQGRDAADLELEAWAEAYFGEDAERYRRTIAEKRYDEPIELFDHHLYDKGGRVLHMLRHELGDEAFFSSIRHYLTKHQHGVVETRDLVRAIEDATGRVLDGFFSQWVTDGAGHPELAVTVEWQPERSAARITVAQKHEGERTASVFRVNTMVRFRVGGRELERRLELTEREQVFWYELPEAPSQAIFDPGRVLLAKLEIDKPEAMWLAELGAPAAGGGDDARPATAGATLAADRIAAARALGRCGSATAVRALTAALERDPFWAVRQAAALALAEQRSEAAATILVRALGVEQHPRARRGIVRALGALRGSPAAEQALGAVVEHGDASCFVEAEACLALGKVRSPRASELLRAAAQRDSFADVIRQHAYRGLAEARDDSAVPFLLQATRWGRPSQGRRAACLALAALARGRRDREARLIREQLEHLLDDADFRVQSAAIEALAVQGDPAASGALRSLIGRALDGRLVRRGREVVRDLEEGAAVGEQLRRLRDELDELRGTTAKLRERLDEVGRAAERAQPTPRKRKAKPRSQPRKPAPRKR